MTHIDTQGAIAAPPVGLMSTAPLDPCRAAPARSMLDRAHLQHGVAKRRRLLADLEARLAAACEQRAARGRARAVHMDDRATWDRATWNRYLAAATELEPEYGPRMRRLWQEIGHLERLAELPVAVTLDPG